MTTTTYKMGSAVIISIVAALGTIPYSYQFAATLGFSQKIPHAIIGYFLSIIGVVANSALSYYSLLKIKLQNTKLNTFFLISLSAISAISIGFMCFAGYQNSLTIYLNLLMSFSVTAANAGVNYTALNNFIDHIKNVFNQIYSQKMNFSFMRVIASTVGFVVGALASSIYYMVAADSLFNIISNFLQGIQPELSYVFALVIWLPTAALFSYGTQAVFVKLLKTLWQVKSEIKKISPLNIIIFLIAIFSGASLTQVALDFASTSRHLPDLLNNQMTYSIISQVLPPLIFLSVASINYIALLGLKDYYQTIKDFTINQPIASKGLGWKLDKP